MTTELGSMTRQQLQALAKKHRIRANQKSAVLVEQLASLLQTEPAAPATDGAVPSTTVEEAGEAGKTQAAPAVAPAPDAVAGVDFTADTVAQASRRELQTLCKAHHIRANQKTDKLRDALLALCAKSASESFVIADDEVEQIAAEDPTPAGGVSAVAVATAVAGAVGPNKEAEEEPAEVPDVAPVAATTLTDTDTGAHAGADADQPAQVADGPTAVVAAPPMPEEAAVAEIVPQVAAAAVADVQPVMEQVEPTLVAPAATAAPNPIAPTAVAAKQQPAVAAAVAPVEPEAAPQATVTMTMTTTTARPAAAVAAKPSSPVSRTTSSSGAAPSKPPISAGMARIVLTSMLRTHAPEKLANLDGLLGRHVGREDELLQRVAAKYGIGFNRGGASSGGSSSSTTTATTTATSAAAPTMPTMAAAAAACKKTAAAGTRKARLPPPPGVRAAAITTAATSKARLPPPGAKAAVSKTVARNGAPAGKKARLPPPGAARTTGRSHARLPPPTRLAAGPCKRKIGGGGGGGAFTHTACQRPAAARHQQVGGTVKRGRLDNNFTNSRRAPTSARVVCGGGAVVKRTAVASIRGGRGLGAGTKSSSAAAQAPKPKPRLSVRPVNQQGSAGTTTGANKATVPAAVPTGTTAAAIKTTTTATTTKKKKKAGGIDWDAIHRRDEQRNLRNTETIWQRQARLKAERSRLHGSAASSASASATA